MYPSDLKYTKDHEWIHADGTHATVGSLTTRRSRWATSCIWSFRTSGAR